MIISSKQYVLIDHLLYIDIKDMASTKSVYDLIFKNIQPSNDEKLKVTIYFLLVFSL